MKSFFLFVTFVILTATVFASPNFVESYSITPASPAPEAPFQINLKGWLPNPCYLAELTSRVGKNAIFLDFFVTPSTRPCIQVVVSWAKEVKISGLKKGFYPIYLRYVSAVPDLNTKYEILGYVPVGLDKIQKCVISDNYKSTLVRSGGFAGWIETFPVLGRYTFIMGGEPGTGWLTDVELYAITGQKTGDINIAEIFGINAEPIYFENYSYSGKTYSDGGEADVKMIFDPASGGIHLDGSVMPGCCDRFQYNLDTYSDIIDHIACTRFPLSDLNKDCKVNIKDFAIMASQWLECNLVYQKSCME